jgi:hypothetical protein
MAKKHTEHTEPNTEAIAETPASAREPSPEQREELVETTHTVVERTAESAESVSEAVREGVSDAREAAIGFIPAVGNFLHKGIYNGFYYLVIGSLIPSNSVVSEAVKDGAQAAKKTFEENEKAAAEAGPASEGLAAS